MGGCQRNCYVGQTARGRGLVASKDLAPGEEALRIPLDLALIEPRISDEHWTARLARRLHAVNENDALYAYRGSLPPPPRIPLRWQENILTEVQNMTLEAEIDALYFWRAELGVDLDALDLVSSRSISLGGTGADSILALVPLLDMANHCPRTGGHYARDGDDVVLIVGAAGARQGEEITLDYGGRSNDHFLLYYGFIPSNNPADSIFLGGKSIHWSDLSVSSESSPSLDPELQRQAADVLGSYPTTLADDLKELDTLAQKYFSIPTDDLFDRRCAIEYRVSKKQLLTAVAGTKAADASTSVFRGIM